MSLGVGIDVGGSSVTVAAVRSKKGSLALEGFLHVPLEELAADGVPVDDLASVARAVAVRLQQRGIRASGAVLGVSGRDAIIRYSLLPPMPAWRLELLMELEVKDTAEKTGEALSADWRQLAGANEGNLVLIALAKDARVLESVAAWQKAGVEPGGALPLPVATGDCYRFLGDGVADKVTLVLDIGRDSTEVAIVELGELIFARSVQTGGEAFTERLAKVLGVSRDEAEQIKREGEDKAGSDVAGALSGPRQQLAAMVVASVDFARGQLRRKKLAIERCVVSGGGARAPGLIETLGKSLGCPAALFDPVAGIDCSRADRVAREDAEAHGLEAATAIGLALSNAIPNASRLDLLPLQIKKQLEFKHRTLFEYVAAGVAVAALVVSLGAALIERGGQRDRSVALSAAKGTVAARLQAHEGRAADNAKREAELRGLSERARPGYALARLLGTIAEGLPQKLSLTEMNLVRDEKAGTVTLEVRGLADNAQGDGADAMRALRAAVEADPEVATADVKALANEGPTLEFVMSIVPVGGQGAATESPPPGEPDEGEVAVDLEAIWQQHKRFILRVAGGALLFTILLAWRSSIAAEAAALVRSNASLQGALQDDMARLENAEGLEKGRADALGARLEPAVLRAVGWKLESGYELPKGERSPELLYASLAARAATEVETAASRWNASVPRGSQGLGLQSEAPAKTRVGEALAQVDLHRRLAIKLLDAGVRTITKIDPQDPRYAPRDAGKGFVRQLPVRITFQASAATLAKALAELQVEGSFVELLSCKVAVRPGKPGVAEPEPLEVELELQALSLVEAMPEGMASADAQPRGGRRGPRRFGRER